MEKYFICICKCVRLNSLIKNKRRRTELNDDDVVGDVNKHSFLR